MPEFINFMISKQRGLYFDVKNVKFMYSDYVLFPWKYSWQTEFTMMLSKETLLKL